MSGRLQDTVCLVTGAGQGIGRATAIALAQEGARVAVNGRVAHPKVDAVATEVGGMVAVADIADPVQAEAMFRNVEDRFGPVEVLVANAAAMFMNPVLAGDLPGLWKQISVNLVAHMDCLRLALPGMRQAGGGRAVFIGSVFGVTGWPNAAAYAATKSGLHALVKSLAKELSPSNIAVSGVAPGIVDTPQLQVDADDAGLSLDEMKRQYAKALPMNAIGTPHDIADTVAFLAGDAGRHFSGSILQPNGGEIRCEA